MSGSGFLGLGPNPSGPEYGSTSDLLTAAAKSQADQKAAQTVPTPQNSKSALDDAAAAAARAKGAAATLFAGRALGGTGGLLSSGSGISQRMLLGS